MPDTQPRPEHPRPQFQRNTWLNLNGTWKFAIDVGQSGEAKGWPQNPADLDRAITVPFCPESSLSGIQYTDFMPSVWYHRTLDIPDEWTGKRVLLHFGAVDYHCKAWVNGHLIGQHYGGSSSFTFDIPDALSSNANHLVICANDDTRSGDQPSGKQCPDLYSRGCHYTRVTGIWQTVWLEAVPESRIDSVRIVPDLDSSRFVLTPTFKNAHRGHTFRAVLLNGKEEVAVSTMPATSGAAMSLRIKNPQPWSPANPHLYDLRFELCDGDTTIDAVNSYAGLRKFHIEGHKFYLNNTPIFLRLVWENTPIRFPEMCVPYQGQPYVVDEYGGTWWDPNAVETEQAADRKSSWGYGKRPTDIEEVYHRIEKLTAILLNHPNIAGYCYTQLTDIEQEQNGIYTYDRREKYDAKRLKKYFGAPAAIEKK